MSTNQIQNAFIWTKVQSDAGQPIDWILNRKELERQSGDTFWWGIGESKADQIKLLLTKDPHPLVLFSLMLSRPHRRDSHPDGVLLWEAYQTAEGQIPLPPHAIVISRAHDSRGRLKQRYYALACENPMGILHSGRERWTLEHCAISVTAANQLDHHRSRRWSSGQLAMAKADHTQSRRARR
jgi:hypothetical protein